MKRLLLVALPRYLDKMQHDDCFRERQKQSPRQHHSDAMEQASHAHDQLSSAPNVFASSERHRSTRALQRLS